MSKKMRLGLALLFVGAIIFTSIFTACTQELIDSILGDGIGIGDRSGGGSGGGSGGDSGGRDSGGGDSGNGTADAAIQEATNAINAANEELSTIDQIIQEAQAAKQQAEADNNNITNQEFKADTKIAEAQTKITEALEKKAELEALIQDAQAKKTAAEGTKSQEDIDNLNNAVQSMQTNLSPTKTTAQEAKTKADYAKALAYSGYTSEALLSALASGQPYTLEKDTDIYNWRAPDFIWSTFDGNGKTLTIKSFSSTASPSEHTLTKAVGPTGHIKNLTIRIEQDINIVGPSTMGLATNRNRGKISNVHIKGEYTLTSTSDGYHATGGLVGINDTTGIIEECSSEINIVGITTVHSSNVGGLVGTNYSPGSITRSYSTGSVKAIGKTRGRAGGLVGYSDGGNTTKSYAKGNVIVESNGSSGNYFAGGLIGESASDITDSYSTGSVSAKNVSYHIVGGFIGRSTGVLTNVYSTASSVEVTGGSNGHRGRFAGDFNVHSGGAINNAFVKNLTSPSNNIGSGTEAVTVISEGPSSQGDMSGFDFASVWTWVGGSWPKLLWQP